MSSSSADRLDGLELTHARVRRLTERCLVAETEPVGSANAGIVIGDDRVLVVDTRVTPSWGEELAAAVRAATGASPAETIVVNTHHHGDHVFGNGAFAPACVLASRWAQEAARREWDEQLAIFRELRPHQRAEFEALAPAPPTVGLVGGACLDLGGLHAEVEPIGPAHTPGDVAVLVPAEGVGYVADLVFNGHWPSTWHADFTGWLGALDDMAVRDLQVVVPGHGAAGGPELLRRMADCLRFLIALELGGGGRDEAAAIAASPFAGHLHPQRVAEARVRVRDQAAELRAAA